MPPAPTPPPTGSSGDGRSSGPPRETVGDAVVSPRAVLARSLTVGVAVAAFGIAYGAAAVAAGLPAWVAVTASAVVFAGASQFAFLAVAQTADPAAAAVSGILLNLRLVGFGYALAPQLGRASLGGRLLDGYLTTDESAALALDGPASGTRRRLRVAGACVWVAWVASTALGAFGGALLGDVRSLGLDVAFPAAFLALLAPALRQRSGRRVALGAVAITLTLLPFVPRGIAILAGAAAVVPTLRSRQAGAP